VTSVPALPGHALFLLLLQVALILAVSRVLAEGMKRIGQPAVLGELMAGLVLGPSLLGWVWPGAMHAIFPAEALQVHLLEVVAWIGMVLLLLLTGLETDIRLLRHLGRSALTSSALGMAIPFASGLALGFFMPDSFLGDPSKRFLFAAFLATAMSISAMPVIAKILMDLELTKRNIGIVILSAGVVDDTTGWLILSLIAGIASAQSSGFMLVLAFLKTLALTLVFLAACAFVFYPFSRKLFRLLDDKARTANADLVAIVGLAFVLSAVTEKIGVHAVFGAFVCGCMLRQVPAIRPATLHRLEAVALSIFAPVFFGMVGLKVDLRTLGSSRMFLIVFAVATAGKLIGCTWGGLLGRMKLWESLAIGVAMNARGAMGLVVTLIGLTLGIISPSMFAIIVVMSIATSFMAPPLLRAIMPLVKMSPEEQARLAAESQRGMFHPERLKALIPTAGGPNALVAGRIAAGLARGEPPTLTLLYVESTEGSLWSRAWKRWRPDQAGRNLQEHLDLIKAYADEKQARVDVRRSMESDPSGYICKEAAQGDFDLILLGAGIKNPLRSSLTTQLLERAPSHIAIVRGRGSIQDCKRLLVATNGSYFSRAALELAILYAEKMGATVTVLYTMEEERLTGVLEEEQPHTRIEEGFRRMMATTLLTTLSPMLTRTQAKVNVIVREGENPTPAVIDEARAGLYQMLVVGAENRAVQHRLSVGYDVERIVNDTPCTVMVVVPKIAGESAGHA
jgi:Kef-type K+ transport system membrane component KefB/nucleotide-binding universal stress UspA family protein